MDEEIEIGGFSMKGKRRLSEDIGYSIDKEEVAKSKLVWLLEIEESKTSKFKFLFSKPPDKDKEDNSDEEKEEDSAPNPIATLIQDRTTAEPEGGEAPKKAGYLPPSSSESGSDDELSDGELERRIKNRGR